MISIDKCDSCIHLPVCIFYTEIQSELDALDHFFKELNPNSKLVSVVTSKHWLGQCDFECKYYEEEIK